jgi:ribonucleoside-diphosphate reductase alpha chain
MKELSPIAEKIFNMKYALTRPSGRKETWEEACVRVANHVSSAEDNESTRLQLLADFTKLLVNRTFLPGGRILANAGTNIRNLMNCFVLPIEDSRESIYGTLTMAAEIFAWGGGIGYNFSSIREEGAPVKTTGGAASGPLSFMGLFNHTGEVISQASRRGAQMGILNVNHPDIIKFVRFKNNLNNANSRILDEYKRNLTKVGLDVKGIKYFDMLRKTLADDQLTHFNISVSIPNCFMDAVKMWFPWELISRTTEERQKVDANELLNLIAENAHANGDPGIFFSTRANMDNMVPYLGHIEATNPCGEVPLLPFEPCCLGSINLCDFVDGTYFDFDYLKVVTKLAIRFLDNVQEVNVTPVTPVNEAAKRTRRLGLGVMGWADVLEEMGIPYDNEEALDLARGIAKTIQHEAWLASQELAEEKGAFPAFDADKVNWTLLDNAKVERKAVRNVACTSIAPTGTISLIGECNSGIEPYYSNSYVRNITEGISNSKTDDIRLGSKSKVKTAHEIAWQDHIKMQAAWQMYTDNAVSKTINMPNTATVKDVRDAYMMAWELRCKGITVYRDGSKAFQILEGA